MSLATNLPKANKLEEWGKTNRIEVTKINEVTPEIVKALEVLVPQLSRSNLPPTGEDLKKLVDSDSSAFFVARQGGGIVGCLTLVMFRIPTGLRARIEDVVVDHPAGGQGIAKMLNLEALRIAKRAGAKTVDLTSGHERVAANQLYKNIGFEARDTNVYRFDLSKIQD